MSAPHSFNLEHAATGFLKEVDDALHEERLLALWHRYKWLVIGLVVVVLVGTMLREGWQAWQQRQNEAAANLWYSYSQNAADEAAKARTLAPLMEASSPGFRALAHVTEAEGAAAAEAAPLYRRIAEDGGMPEWLRDIAGFNTALELMVDDRAAAAAILKDLSGRDGVMRGPALELVAVAAMDEGDTPAARRATEELLALPNLPAGLRARADKRLGALSTLAR